MATLIRFVSIEEIMTLALNGQVHASQWGKYGTVDSTAPLSSSVLFFFSGEDDMINYPARYEWDCYIKLILELDPTGNGIAQYHFSGIDGQWTDRYPEFYADQYSLEDIVSIDLDMVKQHIKWKMWLLDEGFMEDFIQGTAEPWMCNIPIGDFYQLVDKLFK